MSGDAALQTTRQHHHNEVASAPTYARAIMWSMAVARTRRLEIDWSAIRAEFDGIRAAIIPFRVASEQDIERCKLSDMTHGMIASKLVEDWRRNDCVVILDKEKRERLTDLAYMLGFSDDDNFTDDKYKNDGRPNWRQLEELLSQQTVNTEFLHLWSLLNFYFGVYVELYLGNEAIYKREFHQCMMSIGDATQIQRHWYAHWMHETVQSKSRDIGDARSELIAVIENIKAGELKLGGHTRSSGTSACSRSGKDPAAGQINTLVISKLLTRRFLWLRLAAWCRTPWSRGAFSRRCRRIGLNELEIRP